MQGKMLNKAAVGSSNLQQSPFDCKQIMQVLICAPGYQLIKPFTLAVDRCQPL